MAGKVKEITDLSFDTDVVKSSIPVLVDFWAPWCGPCKSLAPLIEELANEYEGKMVFTKMNVDDNPNTPPSYDVRGIPKLVFIKNGIVVDTLVGYVQKTLIKEKIDRVIGL